MWKDVFGKKNEKHDEHDYGKYVGLVCQVKSDENKLFFIGKIDTYDNINREMRVVLHKGEQTPHGVIHNTPVKVIVQSRGNIFVFYGIITGQTDEFWRIEIKSTIKSIEQRDGFRQDIKCKAKVIRCSEVETHPIECELVDISLTGVAFCSDTDFNVGDVIWVTEAVLHKNCRTKYSFKCVIKRVFRNEKDNICYGCEFERMSSSMEDSLCKDLFYLQSIAGKEVR